MSYLVVGVGGTGRGCLAWLKELIGREFPEDLKDFEFFLLDGPDEDASYVLPMGTRFDRHTDGGQIHPLTKSPADVIEKIRDAPNEKEARAAHEFIGAWLRPEQALRINAQNINPEMGFGQSRLPGRANFFLEANTLTTTFNQIAANRTHAFLVGSLVGGTGAGQLVDVAALLRQNLPNGTPLVMLVGVAGGYNAVFHTLEDRTSQNARCFSAVRELFRLGGDPKWQSAYRIPYTRLLTAQNNSLYDLCFLLDGHGALTSQKHPVPPVLGVCNQAAQVILDICLAKGLRTGDFTKWILRPESHPRRFSTAGSHAYVFSPDQTLQAFRYRFVDDFYSRLLDTSDDGASAQRVRATLQSTEFTKMVLQHSRGEKMPWEPPDNAEPLTELWQRYSASNDDRLDMPMLDIYQVARNQGGFLGIGAWPNNVLVNQCRPAVEKAIGKMDDSPDECATVRAYVNREHRRIAKAFQDELVRQLRAVFVDPQTNEPYTLKMRPATLHEAVDVLESLRGSLEAFQTALATFHEHLRDDEKIIEKAQDEIDHDAANLLNTPQRKDMQAQDNHKALAQKLFYLRAWDALMDGMKLTVDQLLRQIDGLWTFFGDPARSWRSFLKGLRDHVRKLRGADVGMRRQLRDELPFMRYLPRAGTQSELDLYNDLVTHEGVLESLLDQCSWVFGREISPDGSEERYRFILQVPPVPGLEHDSDDTRLHDFFTEEVQRSRLHAHTWKLPAQFVENLIKPRLGKMTIWDAFGYDWAEWKRKYASKEPTLEKFVTSKFQKTMDFSEAGLLLQGQHEGKENCQILTSFAAAPSMPGPATEIRALFDQKRKTQKNVSFTDEPSFSRIFGVARHVIGIHPPEWGSYEDVRVDYLKVIDDPEREPMHAQVEEQNARKLERFLHKQHVVDDSYLLNPSVVRFLTSLETFRLFSLAWLFDLLERREDPARPQDPPTVWIDNPRLGPASALNLGPECVLSKVLTTFLDVKNQGFLEVVEKRWGARQKDLLGDKMDRVALATAIHEKSQGPREIWLPEPRSDDALHDPIDRNGLRMAMWAVVEEFRLQLLREQQLSVR